MLKFKEYLWGRKRDDKTPHSKRFEAFNRCHCEISQERSVLRRNQGFGKTRKFETLRKVSETVTNTGKWLDAELFKQTLMQTR